MPRGSRRERRGDRRGDRHGDRRGDRRGDRHGGSWTGGERVDMERLREEEARATGRDRRERSGRSSRSDKIRRENHHLRQNPEEIEEYQEIPRIYGSDVLERRKYYQRKNERRTTNHWGQRKLLLSEIEFLTEYGHLSQTVVYAGAAPGSKNGYLADLFPDHRFVFVDPNPFHEKLHAAAATKPDQIILRNEFFTDDMARSFRGQKVLFISDIRTADYKVMGTEEVEDTVVEDNRMQMTWHILLDAAASMLKYRLPWGKGTTKYLSGFSGEHLGGKIYLPVWGRQSTTETRLVAVGNELADYDHTEYEERMFYFNTVFRLSYFEHPIDTREVPGLCHCYDCAAEYKILFGWARKFEYMWFPGWDGFKSVSEEAVNQQVVSMMLEINRACSTSGHGRNLTHIVGHGQKWFTPKRFDIASQKVIDASGELRQRVGGDPEGAPRAPGGVLYTRKARGEDKFAEELLSQIRAGPSSSSTSLTSTSTRSTDP